MEKQTLGLLGTVSGLVFVGGVIVSVIASEIGDTLQEELVLNKTGLNITLEDDVKIGFKGDWTLGLMYIITGVIGLVAACAQNKCMYVTTCIFASISLIFMGIAFIAYAIIILLQVAAHVSLSKDCADVGGNCTCRVDTNSTTGEKTSTTLGACPDYSTFNALASALLTFLAMTWMAMVSELILACYYTCRRKRAAVVVKIQYQQPMLQLGPGMMVQAYGQPGPDTMSQAYSQPGPDTMSQAYSQPGPDTMSQAYSQPGTDTMSQAYSQPRSQALANPDLT